MSEEITALKEAISLDREALLNDLLHQLGYDELDEVLFQQMLDIVATHDEKRFKYLKALESQQVIDHFMKNKLV